MILGEPAIAANFMSLHESFLSQLFFQQAEGK